MRFGIYGLALTRCTLPSSRVDAPRTKVRWSGLRAAVHPTPGATEPPVITMAAIPTQSAVARKPAASQFVTGSCLLRILATVASTHARQERVAQCSARAGLASGSTRATRHPQGPLGRAQQKLCCPNVTVARIAEVSESVPAGGERARQGPKRAPVAASRDTDGGAAHLSLAADNDSCNRC